MEIVLLVGHVWYTRKTLYSALLLGGDYLLQAAPYTRKYQDKDPESRETWH